MTQIADVSVVSDFDYLQILDDDTVFISTDVGGLSDADNSFPNNPNAGFGSAGSAVITHALGSIPMVRAFIDPEANGVWYNTFAGTPTGFGGDSTIDPWLSFLVDTFQLKLMLNSNDASLSNIPVFYRLYDLGPTAANSDKGIDKIFKKDNFNSVVGAASSSSDPVQTTVTIPHGTGLAPLWKLQFSEDGSNWFDEGTQIVGPFDTTSGPPGGPYSSFYYTRVYGYADSTNFYVRLESNYAGSKTLYVRYSLDYRA